jgi:hypothetical protein
VGALSINKPLVSPLDEGDGQGKKFPINNTIHKGQALPRLPFVISAFS